MKEEHDDKLEKLKECVKEKRSVAFTGSLTVDIPGNAPSHGAEIGPPMLGGSLPWALRGFKSCSGDEESPFNVKAYGPRCPDEDGGKDPLESWNAILLRCLRKSDDRKELKDLTPVPGWEAPVSLQIAYPDGRRDRLQQDRDLSEPERKKCFEKLFEDEPGVLYLGGIWRGHVWKDLAGNLKKLRELGWVIALHPGTFHSKGHPALARVKETFLGLARGWRTCEGGVTRDQDTPWENTRG